MAIVDEADYVPALTNIQDLMRKLEGKFDEGYKGVMVVLDTPCSRKKIDMHPEWCITKVDTSHIVLYRLYTPPSVHSIASEDAILESS